MCLLGTNIDLMTLFYFSLKTKYLNGALIVAPWCSGYMPCAVMWAQVRISTRGVVVQPTQLFILSLGFVDKWVPGDTLGK